MNAYRVAIRVCAVIGLCALSRDAWAQRETGPYGNLFGGQPNGDVDQALSLRWSGYSGYDDVIREQAKELVVTNDRYRDSGNYSGLSAELAYTRGDTANYFSVTGSTNARAYGALREVSMPMFSGGTSFNMRAGRRTSIRGSLFTSYAPYYQLAPFISAAADIVPLSFGFAVASHRSLGFGTDVGVMHHLSARSTLSLNGVWQRTRFEEPGSLNENQNLRMTLAHNLAKGFGVHAGYGYQLARFAIQGPSVAPTTLHNVDAGIDYGRALSFSRRTRLNVGTGSSIVPTLTGGSQLYLTGQAVLQQGLGRTWTASASYNRLSHFEQGFRDLLFVDAFSASLGGQIASRVQLSSAASWSFGTVGLGQTAPSIGTYTGSTRLLIALSHNVALSTTYFYYHYDTPLRAMSISGISSRLDRQALMIGLTGWIPFINDVRPRRDSR